jgi:pimeloyl-ACP methyl ester carboxylesterase
MRSVLILLTALALDPTASIAQSSLPRRALFGVSIVTLSDSARTVLKLPNGTQGVVVQSVTPGGTADAMGIAAGDVVVSLNGTATPENAAFLGVLRGLRTGAAVEARGFRAGAPFTRRGTLLGRPLERTAQWETIATEVTVADRRRRVLITRPLREGPHPLLMVIGGIGPYTMDGPMATIPYAPIFRRFADAGWVTVRVDKPGQGDSEGGDISELVFDDELAGYREALKLMLRTPYVDTSRVVIFGHSMGGSHAAVLASEFPQIKGVVASATIGVTFMEYWLTTLRRQFALSRVPAGDTDRILRAMSQLMPLVIDGGQAPRDVVRARPELAEASMIAFGADGNTLSGMSVPFWRQLNGHNMGLYWSRTNAKVLALAGESDFVATREDLVRIAEIVNASHPGNGQFELLPATDHFLQRRATYAESFATMGKAPGEFNDTIVDVLVRWAAPWWPRSP